jgi:hypothetical protein
MGSPSAESQVEFLTKLQRLLSEGQFVATYKFALLQAIADLAVEHGDDLGGPLEVGIDAIAGKFVRYRTFDARTVTLTARSPPLSSNSVVCPS